MQEQLCLFGPAFLEARSARAISQWTVALRTQYHIRNIQRIERGEHQPGVMLAIRLVAATETDVGEFFERLSLSAAKELPQVPRMMEIFPAIAAMPAMGAVRLASVLNGDQSTQAPEHAHPAIASKPYPGYDVVVLKDVKCIFGPLFQQARLFSGLSQSAIAQHVEYSLRNIGAVEKGKQEPGVMTALGMVKATGVDIKAFFSKLYELSLSPSTVADDQSGQ